jgi:hypothetical protein
VYDLPPNVALVHRIVERDGGLRWEVTRALRRTSGFEEDSRRTSALDLEMPRHPSAAACGTRRA